MNRKLYGIAAATLGYAASFLVVTPAGVGLDAVAGARKDFGQMRLARFRQTPEN
jgi:hypothetical protein